MKSLDPLEAFNCLPDVNAIINLKARLFSNGRIKIVDKNGKEILSHRYTALLQNLNWFQGCNEFMRQTKIFHEVFGNEYLFMLKPVGMEGVKALFTLPPNLVDCEYIDAQPFFLFSDIPRVEYSISLGNNKKMPLEHKDIIHLNDNRIPTRADQKNILVGQSKLEALAPAVSNLFAAYKSRGIIMHRRGAMGILSSDQKDAAGSIPMLEPERADVQKQWKEMYGSDLSQHQIIISNVPLSWKAIELDPRKLGLYEECEEDLNRILDAFGVPGELLVRDQGATYENQNQARKGMYENGTIPEANEWIGAINSVLFQDDSAKAIVDYSHLPIFQEDVKAKNEAMTARVTYLSRLFADGAITHAEYREELHKAGIGNGRPIPGTGEGNKSVSHLNGKANKETVLN